jgi:hypothetical protein
MIQDVHNDCALPRNLLDEDFGPETVDLPPSRPETELTPILYTITKARYSAIFRTVYNRVSLGRSAEYVLFQFC